MIRQGVDVHNSNPGEELNYHGVLGNPNNPFKGANYGYPTCFAAWDLSILPNNTGLQVGSQFAMDQLNSTNSDAICATKQAPRLTFASHTAPLDVKFRADGSAAYISFHGSWYIPSLSGKRRY
jgi:glucose/arabinose dehydrogenase